MPKHKQNRIAENITFVVKDENVVENPTPTDISTVQENNLAKYRSFVQGKVNYLHTLIQDVIFSLEQCNLKEIFSNNDINAGFDALNTIQKKIQTTSGQAIHTSEEFDKITNDLQIMFNQMSKLLSKYGTRHVRDVLYIVFGNNYEKISTELFEASPNKTELSAKYEIILKYVLPIGYVTSPWTEVSTDLPNFECTVPSSSVVQLPLYHSIYGIRIVCLNPRDKKKIVISGLVENIPIHCLLNEPFVQQKLNQICEYFDNAIKELQDPSEFDRHILNRWIETFTIKDVLVYSPKEVYEKYAALIADVKYVKQNRIDVFVKHFFDMNISARREMLIHLFLYDKDNEIQYISYMLYDLIGSNAQGENIDNYDQNILYNSFPWRVKQYFKEAMVNTFHYSQSATSPSNKYDATKISLEQQVLLLRVGEGVKNRAIAKLKDIRDKSEDQAGKSKQYLEGLVKIPFGMYRKEPILTKTDALNTAYSNLCKMGSVATTRKNKYPVYEIAKHSADLKKTYMMRTIPHIQSCLPKLSKTCLLQIAKLLSIPIRSAEKKAVILERIKQISFDEAPVSLSKILKIIDPSNYAATPSVDEIESQIGYIHRSISEITQRLDDSIYGHLHAKTQIMKIVAQWINGEQNGYCFGFEGSPGIGKTSLAKHGLANCLQDDTGVSRPFSFIALGGSCNGSTLEGHNYTYVNSTWGKIADILMESKCMNPIIYIDELDKVSKTEQGREIIGILTHLIDTTQNDEYQDRYFSGIPLDLSKALFIFSYNDPEQIDRILLDRIHRIKFDNLSWTDKLVIVQKYILPELNRKMGFDQTVELSDEVIKHIINHYTMEPGVRKLKEILFDLYGEINIELLAPPSSNNGLEEEVCLPLHISIQDLGIKYLKKYKKIQEKMIHSAPLVGMINGMWANALGKGGIIPVETAYFPSATFLELRLTGLQGDVMKESMNVAKTLAWSLTSNERKTDLMLQFETTRNQGIHIHCPEGAVSKDGPSAGAAITLAIYSLFNDIPIENKASITGEITLQGDITAIGGLDCKILGSVRAGVNTILYPKSNQSDFEEFQSKIGETLDISHIRFVAVSHIRETFSYFYTT